MSEYHDDLNDFEPHVIKNLIENDPDFSPVSIFASSFQADKLRLLVQDYVRIFPNLACDQLNFRSLFIFGWM
jgi:hypothetical protein